MPFRYTAELKNKLDSFQPSSSSQFPAYINYKTRVLTFGEIKQRRIVQTETIEDLAAFGFFYEGKNFRVYILVEIYCFDDDATENMQNQIIINRYFMLQEWT